MIQSCYVTTTRIHQYLIHHNIYQIRPSLNHGRVKRATRSKIRSIKQHFIISCHGLVTINHINPTRQEAQPGLVIDHIEYSPSPGSPAPPVVYALCSQSSTLQSIISNSIKSITPSSPAPESSPPSKTDMAMAHVATHSQDRPSSYLSSLQFQFHSMPSANPDLHAESLLV